MSANTAALAGALHFMPGSQTAPIVSSRHALAGQILRGKPPQAAVQWLPKIYSLCGSAHAWSAQAAVDKALQGLQQSSQTTLQAEPVLGIDLVLETAREHVRRLFLDWSRLLLPKDGQVDGQAAYLNQLTELRHCPLFLADGRHLGVALDQWLVQQVYGQPLEQWLNAWLQHPGHAMQDWLTHTNTLPAQCLLACRSEAVAMQLTMPALLPHAGQQDMLMWLRQGWSDPQFDMQPLWQGQPCETGVMTRLSSMHWVKQQQWNCWLRLGQRLAELAGLVLKMQGQHDNLAVQFDLDRGAAVLEAGQGVSWCEMARGLLVHWVKLAVTKDEVLIVDYRVIAPTEWNFHPQGGLAHHVAAMRETGSAARLRYEREIAVLVAAFDPCVQYDVEWCDA